MASQSERAGWIARIRALPGHLESLTEGLSAEQLTTRFMENEWSVAQNIHHLADAHMHVFLRTKWALTEEHSSIRPYQQDDWASSAESVHAEIEESLLLLKGLHARWARLLESLSEEQWQRAGLHLVRQTEISVERMAEVYAKHGEDHLDQISRTLAAGGIQRPNPAG